MHHAQKKKMEVSGRIKAISEVNYIFSSGFAHNTHASISNRINQHKSRKLSESTKSLFVCFLKRIITTGDLSDMFYNLKNVSTGFICGQSSYLHHKVILTPSSSLYGFSRLYTASITLRLQGEH